MVVALCSTHPAYFYATADMTPAQIAAALAGVTAAQIVTYDYDAFGRQTTVAIDRDPANPGTDVDVTATAYDAEGRVITLASPQGTINYEYDDLGRKVRTYTDNTDTRYTYDSLGRLKTVAVHERNNAALPTPETTTYEYDLVGNLDEVGGWH